jgi:hypothetical protein
MFIEKLRISTKDKIIRELNFCSGMNLIIDNTPLTAGLKSTGNNVGKTTVLKLIYFCLGGEDKDIYTDVENKSKVYEEVRSFLINQEVLITLTLINGFNVQNEERLIIERNFLSGKKAVRRINGKFILKKDFENELLAKIFPEHKNEKPSFKQIISHNIRYKDNSINNTLKTLSSYTSDVEYETLYLYLLGCEFDNGAKKIALTDKIKQEKAYKERIEKKQKKNSYEVALAIVEDEILELNKRKSLLNINENFEQDLNRLNEVKYKINRLSSRVTKLEIRRDMIVEAKNEMGKDVSTIDLEQLKLLYSESKEYIPNLHKTFEDLVNYHNKMILEKISFITKELPSLEGTIEEEKRKLKTLLQDEKELSIKISKSDSFNDIESIISEINEKYRLKGEYENTISQINEVDSVIKEIEDDLENIDQYLYSSEYQEKLKKQINKFNKFFSSVSNELYGERYALSYEIVMNKKTNKPIYKFSTFNSNMSSGKKQGEILCFDLAYIMFANEEGISCLHFLLNDKKELMHDNQLSKVANFVFEKNIQLVASILRDKLPDDLLNTANIVVELSQEDKLFKIES